jgi:hypothetical protein
VLQRLAGDLDHPADAAALDHLGEHRGQALGPGDGHADRVGRHPVGPAERADQTEPGAGRLEDRPQEQARHRLASRAGDADRHQLLAGVARQGVTEPRQRDPRIGHDHLEPTGLGAGALDHHPRRAPVERLPDERMPVVPPPPDRDEDLARVEPAAVGRAAGDLPVVAPHELGLGEHAAKAHRWNSLLGQTVNEPARHRLSPPCQS